MAGLLSLIRNLFLPDIFLTSIAIGVDSVSHPSSFFFFFEGAAIVLGTSRRLGPGSWIATDRCVP